MRARDVVLAAMESAATAKDTRIAELEARIAAMEWRPIETAPVGGKAFLVWVPENKCVFAVCFKSYQGVVGRTLWGSSMEFTYNATHWMPLPAPPATEVKS